jgi:hypothetical protein
MLQKACTHVGNAGIGHSFTFLQGSGEDPSKVLPENESVDLLVSGTAYFVSSEFLPNLMSLSSGVPLV